MFWKVLMVFIWWFYVHQIDFGDIYHLNAELLEYLQTSKQAGPSTAPALGPARAPKGERVSFMADSISLLINPVFTAVDPLVYPLVCHVLSFSPFNVFTF